MMQEEKGGVKGERQGMLDKLIKKPSELLVFMHENVLHFVTQFVAVDNQVNPHQESNTEILITCHSPFLLQTKQHLVTAWLQCIQS